MSDDGTVLPFPGAVPAPVAATEWSDEEVMSGVEALLFAAGEPASVAELADALGVLERSQVLTALRLLADRSGGVRVVEVAGGWQMRTDPRFAEAVLRLRGGKPQTMSRAALEALAVVAYRQPVTRAEVDDLRGVASGGVLKTLLDRGYVKVVGRRDEPGRPLEYGTTAMFLQVFELAGLHTLPTLAEREELAEGEQVLFGPAEE